MKAEYEEKFIVIAKKDLLENSKSRAEFLSSSAVDLLIALYDYNNALNKHGGAGRGKRFYVCNQDEPYAQEIIDRILRGEDEKHDSENSGEK